MLRLAADCANGGAGGAVDCGYVAVHFAATGAHRRTFQGIRSHLLTSVALHSDQAHAIPHGDGVSGSTRVFFGVF